MIYYSNNFDLEKRLQSEDRAHRIGQVNKVTYVDIICKDTVDEKIVASLLAKQNIAAQVLGTLAEAGVHVRVISQGAIKVNIGLVIQQVDLDEAVNRLHAHFFP